MTKEAQVDQELEDALEELEIDSTQDYGFVFGGDGELKHFFTPAEFMLDPPPIVKKVLKLLGIKDINSMSGEFGNDTLH